MSSPQSGGNASLKGPMLMVAAMGGFAIEDAFIKTLSASVPPGEVGLALGLGGALAFWIAMRRKGERFLDPRAIRRGRDEDNKVVGMGDHLPSFIALSFDERRTD